MSSYRRHPHMSSNNNTLTLNSATHLVTVTHHYTHSHTSKRHSPSHTNTYALCILRTFRVRMCDTYTTCIIIAAVLQLSSIIICSFTNNKIHTTTSSKPHQNTDKNSNILRKFDRCGFFSRLARKWSKNRP